MANSQPEQLTIENAELKFINFSGREKTYNEEGNRNFSVVIPESDVQALLDAGWNVKLNRDKNAKNEDDARDPFWHIPVTVSYKIRPPRVTMIASGRRTVLDEDMVGTLDYADIQLVDLVLNGRRWDDNGVPRIKAYLKTAYVTINEDPMERKYALKGDPDA